MGTNPRRTKHDMGTMGTTLWKEALFTIGVMSVRLNCFRQPSEPQPNTKSMKKLQMEPIAIYIDAWENVDIDLG